MEKLQKDIEVLQGQMIGVTVACCVIAKTLSRLDKKAHEELMFALQDIIQSVESLPDMQSVLSPLKSILSSSKEPDKASSLVDWLHKADQSNPQ